MEITFAIPFDDDDSNYYFQILNLIDETIEDKRRFPHEDAFDNAKKLIDNFISHINQ